MIKLIASDVDGTLVSECSGQINPEYYEVISALMDKGITFCIASGRQFTSIQKLFAPISHRIFYITEGGAVLRDSHQVHYTERIPEADIRELLQDCYQIPEIDFLTATPDVSFVRDTSTPMSRLLADSCGFLLEEADLSRPDIYKQTVKLSIYHEISAESICGDSIIPKWKDRLQVVCSGRYWIDCLAKPSSKGNALASLQKELGISPEETMVFGDNMNDLSMFRQAKYSYAAGSARQEVKDAACGVVAPYQEDGVLQKLKTLL